MTTKSDAAQANTPKESDAQRLIRLCDEDGDFVTGDDGYVVYWPGRNNGSLNARMLRIITDELDRRNAAWDAVVQQVEGPSA